MHNYLAIIPARKNSFRLKDKNIKIFRKKPMIEYTFDLIKKIKKIDFPILSSNDNKIIKLAKRKNILVPFKRPENLSKKDSEVKDVILHALKWYKKLHVSYPNNIILLQPTSPLRNTKEIKKAIAKYEKINCNSLVSACEPFQDPNDLYFSDYKNKIIKPLIKAKKINNKKKNILFIDGSIYICKTKYFLKKKKFFDKKTKLFLVKKKHAFDINNKFDFALAEAYSNFNNNK